MKLAIYSKERKSVAEKLGVGPGADDFGSIARFFSSPETLASRLMRLDYANAIVVLVARNKKELSRLRLAVPPTRFSKIVLILPDREPDTIKTGYRFEPRFLSFIDSDFGKIKAVLRQMISKSLPSPPLDPVWRCETAA